MSVLSSEQKTISTGKDVAKKLSGGDIVLLHGELGAGKTTLTKGIARGLGVKDDIVSPTFTLMNVYQGDVFTMVHVDTYRLESEQDLIDIGIQDYLGAPDTICIIEWPEKIQGLLKGKETKDIDLKHEGTGREIKIRL